MASTWTTGQVALLAGAATLGVVAQAVVLIPSLRRAGVHYRPRWGLRGSGLGRAGNVATWTLIGLTVGQLGYIVVSRVASQAPGAAAGAVACAAPGAIAGNAAYDYAFLIFMLPHSLVTVSLATALFTRLSGQAHDADVDGVRATLSSGLRVVGIFTIAATAVVAVLVTPITQLVLWTATPAAAHAVAGVVLTMILGLSAFGAWSMCQRVYYAYEDARGMVPIQVVMAAVVVVGTLLGRSVLTPAHWVAGAGLAMSVSYFVGTGLALWHLRRRLITVDGPHVVQVHARALLAGIVAAAFGLGLQLVLSHTLPGGHLSSIIECVAVGTLMGLVYLGGLRVLRVRELDQLLGPLLARIPGAGRLRGGRR